MHLRAGPFHSHTPVGKLQGGKKWLSLSRGILGKIAEGERRLLIAVKPVNNEVTDESYTGSCVYIQVHVKIKGKEYRIR